MTAENRTTVEATTEAGSAGQQAGRYPSYVLRPDWKLYLLPHLLGILLTPLLGAGIWLILHYRKKWKAIRYRITDSEILLLESESRTEIPLIQIHSCSTEHTRLQSYFGLGDIVIIHEEGTGRLRFIDDPGPVAKLLEKAAASERERRKMRQKIEQTVPKHPSGTLDKKNELVGLWQQGLLSEEDYHREIKKFE